MTAPVSAAGRDKMVSAYGALERERAAWVKGMMRGYECGQRGLHSDWPGLDNLDAAAAREYPAPKVTRPRVATDPMGRGYEFRAVNGRIEVREVAPNACSAWMKTDTLELTANRVALWADLLQNPTEEVEADDALSPSSPREQTEEGR